MPATPGGAEVAVVTVSYGSGGVLADFLASIPIASGGARVRTIVADNRPGDASVEDLVRSAGAGYVALPGNPGYGGAINTVVRDLDPAVEWILISNPDIVLGDRAIERLVATGGQDAAIGAVGPAVRTPEGTIYPSARRIPSLRTGVGHALFANVWPANPWTRAYREESSPYRRDAGWLSGSCLLVRRSTFDGIHGFDEQYFMYFEDVDLGYRIGRAGFRNVYEPGASVTHIGAHSTSGDQAAAMIDAHHRSAKRFLRRKYRAWWLWPVRVALGMGLSLRSWIVTRKSAA
jgi:N-acetylglucosaminyl-diphospho-decaprenol L-rhamnosyltransferase